MRTRMLVATIFALLGGALALAQSNDDAKYEKGDFVPDFDAQEWMNDDAGEPSLGELRGMIVVIFFWQSWQDIEQSLLPFLNLAEQHPQIGRAGGVYVVGLTTSDRDTSWEKIQRAKATFPVGFESKYADELGLDSTLGFAVVDPEGKLAFLGEGFDLNNVQKAIVDSMGETPTVRNHPLERPVIEAELAEARSEIRAGKYTDAGAAIVAAARRSVTGDALTAEVGEMLDLLEAIARERLLQVPAMIDAKEFDEAAKTLYDLEVNFYVTEFGQDAREMAKELGERFSKFNDAMDKLRGSRAAIRTCFDAIANLRNQRFGEAYDQFEQVVTGYPDSDAATYAKEVMKRMKSHDAVWKIVRDHQASPQCTKMLNEARAFIRKRDKAAAERILIQIVKEFPDTKWSEEARDLLLKL